MVMSVNTNISSLNAQHNLAKSQSKLSTAIERLSSGMRINSAKDDAAGLSISTRFTTQINGLNQAVRNANDGISMAQTTESALNEVTNNLQRIRELAVQSASGSNSVEDRAALNKEVKQRLSEIDRIATQTSFNNKNVLDGTAGVTRFQVGANVGQTIDLDLSQSVKSDQIGQYTKTSATETGTALVFGGAGNTMNLAGPATIQVGTKTATIAQGDYTRETLQSAINSAFNTGGITNATATIGSDNKLVVESRVNLNLAGEVSTDGDITGDTTLGMAGTLMAATSAASSSLSTADISTAAGANDMMDSIDAALQTISDMRSDLGAVQNRFDSTISNLQTISQNLSASRSQIQDADFAQETANMSSANILQQAGVSVLAQANSSTQSVLKLLQ